MYEKMDIRHKSVHFIVCVLWCVLWCVYVCVEQYTAVTVESGVESFAKDREEH